MALLRSSLVTRQIVSMLVKYQTSAVSSFIPGRFYSHQESLPHLPIPSLQQTLDKYLKTLKPILNKDEFQHTESLVREFGKSKGLGEHLHGKLLERAERKENWLSEWWLQVAYLQSRASVVVHCSPSVSLPRYDFKGVEGQIKQAAKIIAGILDYKVLIDDETLPVEKLGKTPLCMDQYYRVLSSCRIPGLHSDESHCYARSWEPPRHITVIHNNHFFELPVYHPNWGPLTVSELESQLSRIVANSPQLGEAVGILTADNRDSWGKAYQLLQSADENKASIKSIQRSIFALCLDRPIPKVPDEKWRSNLSARCLHGGGSQQNSANRWFDKTIQIIVDQNGGAGLCYEHSPAEGPPIAAMLDHVHKYCEESPAQPESSTMSLPLPKHLPFTVVKGVESYIESAAKSIDSIIDFTSFRILDFKDYGKNFIKLHKMSPDSYIQNAFQLAYYSLHNKVPATYESGSLRRFRLGRTDTIRSSTIASDRFCKAMVERKSPSQELATLLRDAVKAHKEYTVEAISGQGIDRHLLGMKLASIETGEDMPDIFTDKSYSRAMHFNLSTSQVPAQSDLCMAFGPAVTDGYGLCYNPKPERVLFSLSSFNENKDYDLKSFETKLVQALNDMRDLLISTSSKL